MSIVVVGPTLACKEPQGTALLLRAGSSRYVVPALSLEQQLKDDVAVEVHALAGRLFTRQ